MTVIDSTPANGSALVARSLKPQIIFSVDIDPATVNPANVSLTNGSGNVDATFSVADDLVTVHPAAPLQPLRRHTLTVSNRVRGRANEALEAPFILNFTTSDIGWDAPAVVPESLRVSDLGMDAAGNVVVVGRDLYGVLISRYEVARGWSGPIRIIAPPLDGSGGTEMEVDNTGNAIVFWRRRPTPTIPSTALWVVRYDARAEVWDTPTMISDPSMNATDARMAFDAAGNAIAVWVQSDANNTVSNVFAAFSVAGGGWSAASSIQTDTSLSGAHPNVAVDGDGNATIVWLERTPALTFTARASRYVVGTGARLAETVLTPTQFPTFAGADLGVDAAGNVIFLLAAGSHLMASRYTAVAGWDTFAPISTLDHSRSPKIAVNGAGDAFVTWFETHGKWSLWFTRYVVGTGWERPTTAPETDYEFGSPDIGIDGAGNGVIAWWEAKPSIGIAPTGHALVWSNRYVVGNGWGTPTLMQSDPSGVGSNPQLAMNANGHVFMLWQQTEQARFTTYWYSRAR